MSDIVSHSHPCVLNTMPAKKAAKLIKTKKAAKLIMAKKAANILFVMKRRRLYRLRQMAEWLSKLKSKIDIMEQLFGDSE